MRDRKEQIIKEAIKIVAEEGYGNLSMRAVARASGLKLGALQYHFPHWADLLRGMADYIMDQYSLPAASAGPKHPVDIVDVVQYVMDDAAGVTLNSERLFPQLWAMAQVEPIMNKLMAEIYGRYIDVLEKILADSGVPHPRVHARALTVLLESSLLFLNWDRRAKKSGKAEREMIMTYLDSLKISGKRKRINPRARQITP